MTAQEIADAAKRLGLSSVPHTKQGVNKRARTEGWSDADDLCRKRAGVGGGMEYHISLLPPAMQASLAAEVSRQVTMRDNQAKRGLEIVKRDVLDTSALTARQREVMNARSLVLAAVENVQVAEGRTRSQTVDLLVADPCKFDLDGETLALANDRKTQSTTLARRTVLRWFQYRDSSGIGALAPKATKGQENIPDWFWAFLPHYARPQKPCITEALDAFRLSASEVPAEASYDKVRRLLSKLGNVERHRGREGSLTLKARMAYVTRSTSDLLPTCVYTSDGKTFDAEVAHPIHGRPFRPEITSVVDVATRRCVGFSVGLAENAVGVVDALRYSCETYGVPAIFYVDRGAGFKNNVLDARLTGLMGRLGITKYHSLPQNSQARGIIERFQGSVWNKLSREFNTYVGAPMDRQARQKSFKITRRQIKEFGTSVTLPTWEEFLDQCRKAIEVYNEKPHAALPDRMSPNECWEWHVGNGFEPVAVTAHESADLFRPYVPRKVRRCLIEFNTNKYFHAGLQEYNGDTVLVGYDIHDANHVWVREVDQINGDEAPGRLICIAKFGGNEERYVPLTMERAAQEKRAEAASKRLAEKQRAVEEELGPAPMLEHQPELPMQAFETPAQSELLEGDFVRLGEGSDVAEARATNGAPRFGSDDELALWALSHPDELHPTQVSVLIDCMNDPGDRQLLIDHGVDVEALADILRRAA
ncbi:MAG: Mu transposase C-terminal domain-containing protein [Marinovum sp.]|nr:Mu transposase C-terminal domain-containing protein [Marinovum sp.]